MVDDPLSENYGILKNYELKGSCCPDYPGKSRGMNIQVKCDDIKKEFYETISTDETILR